MSMLRRLSLAGRFLQASLALLPVGMGLDPKKRDALAAGLLSLRIVNDMPACVSGETFDWPQVVFDSPDDAFCAALESVVRLEN